MENTERGIGLRSKRPRVSGTANIPTGLAAGCWLLAAGCWLLPAARCLLRSVRRAGAALRCRVAQATCCDLRHRSVPSRHSRRHLQWRAVQRRIITDGKH